MDKRIIKTRRALGDALIALLEEQAFHQITIRQITDKAGVAYSTFFRNFESTQDLLNAHLDQFIDEIRTLSMPSELLTFREASRQKMALIFDHVSNNQAIYRVLLTTSAAHPALDTCKEELATQHLAIAEPFSTQLREDAPPLELVIHNSVSQLCGIIEWTLEQDSVVASDRMSLYYEQMVTIPMWRLLLGNELAHELLGIPLP